METFYVHAASCDVCAQRLKDAIQMLAEEGDAAEMEFVARLESSQPAWQERLAEQLASVAKSRKTGRAVAGKPKLSWFAMHWRYAAIFAAAALASISFWLVQRRHEAPVIATPPMVATVVKPKVEPRPRTFNKTTALVNEPQPALIAALTVEPGLTRGVDRIPVLKLATQTKTVNVTLLFLDEPPKTIHIELMNSGQRPVWSGDLALRDQDVAGRRVVVSIPARAMTPNDYQIWASERTASGTEHVASYTYRVIR